MNAVKVLIVFIHIAHSSFETGAHVTQAGLKLAMYAKLALNS